MNKSGVANKRAKVMLWISLIFILSGCAWGYWWYTILRFQQSTDDAYVAGNLIQVSSQINGTVVKINIDDNQAIKEGELVLNLDPVDFELALANARQNLAQTVRSTHQLMAEADQLKALIEMRRIAMDQMQDNLGRRQVLGAKNAIGKEELNQAKNNFLSAQQALIQAQEQYKAIRVMLLNTPLDKQPAVELAASKVRECWLNLQRTKILSPASGQVIKRSVQVGNQVSPGRPLLTIVPLDEIWIDANFKEVQLANLRLGQAATVTVDIYGNKAIYHGEVAGFAAGTGSAFSLLPPQNATGNWIKIVQRVPVRIKINPEDLKKHPLLIGLSCMVTVDTSKTDGQPLASASPALKPAASLETNSLNLDFAGVNQLITEIITQNSQE